MALGVVPALGVVIIEVAAEGALATMDCSGRAVGFVDKREMEGREAEELAAAVIDDAPDAAEEAAADEGADEEEEAAEIALEEAEAARTMEACWRAACSKGLWASARSGKDATEIAETSFMVVWLEGEKGMEAKSESSGLRQHNAEQARSSRALSHEPLHRRPKAPLSAPLPLHFIFPLSLSHPRSWQRSKGNHPRDMSSS